VETPETRSEKQPLLILKKFLSEIRKKELAKWMQKVYNL